MAARIYSPAKNAMQSGQGKTGRWVLEYDRASARSVEPLMGWTSSSDMNTQIRMVFDSAEDAVAYAKRNGIAFRLIEPQKKQPRPASYSDNFKFGRVQNWTH